MENRLDSIIKKLFPSRSFREKLGMRLFQYLTFSNCNGLPNMVNKKQNFQDLLNKVQTIHGPLFDYSRLENEVYVLYRSNDFVRKHARDLITFIKSVNLQPGFSEV